MFTAQYRLSCGRQLPPLKGADGEAATCRGQPFVQREGCPEPASVQIQLALERAMSNIVSTGAGAFVVGRGRVSAAFARQSKSSAPMAVCSARAGVVSGSRTARSRGRKRSFTCSEIFKNRTFGDRRLRQDRHRTGRPRRCGWRLEAGADRIMRHAFPPVMRQTVAIRLMPRRAVRGPKRQPADQAAQIGPRQRFSAAAAISGGASLSGIPPLVQSAVWIDGRRVAEIRRCGLGAAA